MITAESIKGTVSARLTTLNYTHAMESLYLINEGIEVVRVAFMSKRTGYPTYLSCSIKGAWNIRQYTNCFIKRILRYDE